MDLFAGKEKKGHNADDTPLAVRMRPRTLDEFVGQEHVLAEGTLLRRSIEAGRLTSLILFGPPGTGKTALAHIITGLKKFRFFRVNAVASNIAEIRKLISAAKKHYAVDARKTVLFIDEIHRFNKAQQDILMPDVEMGNPVLVGTTTHNPFFSIIPPLISRSLVCEFYALKETDIRTLLARALSDVQRGLGAYHVESSDEALSVLAGLSEGDARRALNALEIGVLTTAPDASGVIHFTREVAEESIQKKAVRYDRDEDNHYDTASAFIKSMRGSDPDATLYWLAKMIYAGEDPRFIARRIVIAAAEDVGNADPRALSVAQAALQASEFVGMPEARIPLAQAAVYIACAPKSNAAYLGIEKALQAVKEEPSHEVPLHLKDASYRGAACLGRGEGYKYAHDYKGHYVAQDYGAKGASYYVPTEIGYEKSIKERLLSFKKQSR